MQRRACFRRHRNHRIIRLEGNNMDVMLFGPIAPLSLGVGAGIYRAEITESLDIQQNGSLESKIICFIKKKCYISCISKFTVAHLYRLHKSGKIYTTFLNKVLSRNHCFFVLLHTLCHTPKQNAPPCPISLYLLYSLVFSHSLMNSLLRAMWNAHFFHNIFLALLGRIIYICF